MHGGYVRFKLDPNVTDTNVEPVQLVNLPGEMPKVDDRYLTKPYNNVFMCHHANISGELSKGGPWNSIARCDLSTGKYTHWCAGPTTLLEEVAFVPRGSDGQYSIL